MFAHVRLIDHGLDYLGNRDQIDHDLDHLDNRDQIDHDLDHPDSILPLGCVVQDVYRHVLDNAGYTGPTWKHDLDHTDQE